MQPAWRRSRGWVANRYDPQTTCEARPRAMHASPRKRCLVTHACTPTISTRLAPTRPSSHADTRTLRQREQQGTRGTTPGTERFGNPRSPRYTRKDMKIRKTPDGAKKDKHYVVYLSHTGNGRECGRNGKRVGKTETGPQRSAQRLRSGSGRSGARRKRSWLQAKAVKWWTLFERAAAPLRAPAGPHGEWRW